MAGGDATAEARGDDRSPLEAALSTRTFLRAQVTSRDGVLASILLNGIAPLIAYQLLTARGVAPTPALTLTAVFPVLGILAGWARTRRADAIAVLSLVIIAVGVGGSLLTGSPRFYLVRVSFGTAAFGLLCLGSLLARRPLIFTLSRQVIAGGDAGRLARYDGLWADARFRRAQRVLTATWGVAYVLEAGTRALIAWALPIGTVLLVEPVLGYAVLFTLIAWTIRYARAGIRAAARTGLSP